MVEAVYRSYCFCLYSIVMQQTEFMVLLAEGRFTDPNVKYQVSYIDYTYDQSNIAVVVRHLRKILAFDIAHCLPASSTTSMAFESLSDTRCVLVSNYRNIRNVFQVRAYVPCYVTPPTGPKCVFSSVTVMLRKVQDKIL